MKNRRLLFFLSASLLLLVITVCWEYLFDRQGEEVWVTRFEKQLHDKEIQSDALLLSLSDSLDVSRYAGIKDIVFLAFQDGKLLFWSSEVIGEDGLYDKLNGIGNFVQVNNIYYEVRRLTKNGKEYFALLHIKDDYPYTNKYVKNKFSSYLGIKEGDADNIRVSRFAEDEELLVKDKEGNSLFYIQHDKNYKDRSTNYFLLAFYCLFFFSLFYIYDRLLLLAGSLRMQIVCIVGFIVFLLLLRVVLIRNGIPDSVFRLYLFDNNISRAVFVTSVGDMLISAFCVCLVLYITFSNIRINYQSPRLIRYRYFFVGGFVILAWLYLNFLNFGITSLIENTNIHLNLARIVYIGLPSVVAFIAIIFVGLGLIVIIDSAVSCFKNFMSFTVIVRMVTGIVLFLAIISHFFHLYTTFWNCIFWLGIYLLAVINRYWVRRDMQRSIYMVSVFLLSVYIVVEARENEQYRELTQRVEYATELIEERDYNFEEKLQKINVQIEESEVIAELIALNDEEMLRTCLTNELLDMTGYNYKSSIILCHKEKIIDGVSENMLDCLTASDRIITESGVRIIQTNFYSIVDFDGQISYVGRFSYGDGVLYLRFDSMKDIESSGYQQLLSRTSDEGENIIYPYSYAKYKNGKLIYLSGEYNYYRDLSSFGEYGEDIDVVEKDGYSHMLIPANGGNILVISLHDAFFTLYLVNILYAFFICMIIASYGLFFTPKHVANLRKGTLKVRIKNGIVALVAILFVIMTVMSIYLNAISFEQRHNTKVTEFLKFINKELEPLACVDSRECPDIIEKLSNISEILAVDVNIYSDKGVLVATSRPEIFEAGFDGRLINPSALKKIMQDGTMNYVEKEKIGELGFMSAYMPLVLKNGKTYLLNVPYFTQNDELNTDIIIMVIIAINIAIVVMALAFFLAGIVAERATKPLQLVNDKLRQMRFGGKNEKIVYKRNDEVGALVKEYNNMVAKLDESVRLLARSEREEAWREMARQVAHEIKNPLTPMKLNIQFMLRSMQIENQDEFKQRFKDVSAILIEQIDNMASIASAFSDFAKMPVGNNEMFDFSEMVGNSAFLFEKNVDSLECDIEPGISVFADKEQIQRVIVNLLKNAEQSIPEGQRGCVQVCVKRNGRQVVVTIKDNGAGIPDELRDKIFEPNFTTKTSGTGLGLAISRKIIENMGGTIDFSSVINKGTEFFVTLNCVI